MFSNDSIAGYINSHFEPTWESLRPVPTLHLDFGNGKRLTRTMHGNIATYVLDPEGRVVDLVSGIYEPGSYLKVLKSFNKLASELRPLSGSQKLAALKALYSNRAADPNKLGNSSPDFSSTAADGASGQISRDKNYQLLIADTRLNEGVRRRKINLLLAQNPLKEPRQVVKTLFRDVLSCDLDDPYLGLETALGKDYPWN